jgi:hypothetical protein
MRQLSILILIILGHFAFGQNKNCNCPKNDITATGKADRVFTLSNGNSIGLCGFIDKGNKDTTYSEFILFQCGHTKIFKQWDATQSCKISTTKDTLIIQELYGLAIDEKLEVTWVPFYITKLYFDKSTVRSISYFRKELPKYSTTQIKTVLKQYNGLARQADGDSILLVAHRLFWAYVSGSREAAKHLDDFEKHFGPFDGAIAEEFHHLWATYKLFKL